KIVSGAIPAVSVAENWLLMSVAPVGLTAKFRNTEPTALGVRLPNRSTACTSIGSAWPAVSCAAEATNCRALDAAGWIVKEELPPGASPGVFACGESAPGGVWMLMPLNVAAPATAWPVVDPCSVEARGVV